MGNQTAIINADGRVETKIYDEAGRVVTYQYDEAGNLIELGYPDGTSVLYTYDLNNNITKANALILLIIKLR